MKAEYTPSHDAGHPTVTPVDLRQARFGTAMGGFKRAEVQAFLETVAADYESALRDGERLRQEIARLEASLNHYRELEGSLKGALLGAQKVADDVRENARQEAARIVREAEGQVDLLAQQAQARVDDAQRQIDGLMMKRREVEVHIESSISTLHHALDFIRESDQHERQHRPASHPSLFGVTARTA